MRKITIKERSGSYQIRFMVNGVSYVKTYGTVGDEDSLAELEAVCRRIRRDVNAGRFSELDSYFPQSEQWDKRKIIHALSELRTSTPHAAALLMHATNYGGKINSQQDVKTFLNALSISEPSKARYLSTMKMVCPCLCVGLSFRQSQGQPDPFNEGELSKILAACEDENLRSLIMVWYHTGLRTGELAGLTEDAIDESAGTLKVLRAWSRHKKDFKVAKSGQGRIIRTPQHILVMTKLLSQQETWLRRLRDPSVFTRRYWKPLLKKAGVRYRKPYCLRHTAASRKIVQYRGDLARVAYEMGHSIDVLARHYAGVLHSMKDCILGR